MVRWKLYRLVKSTMEHNDWINYIVKSNKHTYSPAFNTSENRFAQGGEILRLNCDPNAEEIKKAIQEDAMNANKQHVGKEHN